jgi:phosphatidylserine synthase
MLSNAELGSLMSSSRYSIDRRKLLFLISIKLALIGAIVACTSQGVFARVELLVTNHRYDTLVPYVAIWGISLLAIAIAALRLARFNVMSADSRRPSWAGLYFTGVPAPAGAFLVLLPIYLANSGWMTAEAAAVLGLFSLPLVAVLMISTLPTFSGKQTQRKALSVMFLPSLGVGLLAAAGLYWAPWATLTLAAIAYVLSFPISYRSRRRKLRASA